MARSSEGPWFRRAKNTWYVTVGKKKISLGVQGEKNRAEAVRAWHRLMAGELGQAVEPLLKTNPEAYKSSTISVPLQRVVDAFLADAPSRMSLGCLRNYCCFLEPFAERFGKRQAESLLPQEAEGYARKPEWSSTYRANFLTAIGAVYRWALREGLITTNPMISLRKPVRESRGSSVVLSADNYRKLIHHAKPDTKDLLVMLWATGARPAEICGLTAEQVRASTDGVIPITAHKTAHKGKARFLVLTGEAWTIARRRAERRTGLLFPSETCGRLTAQAVGHRLKKLCRRAGVPHTIPYGFRHAFATDALTKGIPDATVAALLGHTNTAMLYRHYSHLTSRADLLRAAALSVRGEL